MPQPHRVSSPSPPPLSIVEDNSVDTTAAMFDEGFGLNLGGRRFYVNVRIGLEQRASERLAAEGQVRVSGVAFLYLVICSGAIMLFGTLCLLYLIKSALGIDLSSGDSFLHPLFEVMRGV